jgi:hypothetical protein
MRCAVFRGIGGVAHKYYLLFQHHLAPPVSTFTTGKVLDCSARVSAEDPEDARQTMSAEGPRPDPRQLENTYVLQEKVVDTSYIVGPKPGVSHYISFLSTC